MWCGVVYYGTMDEYGNHTQWKEEDCIYVWLCIQECIFHINMPQGIIPYMNMKG